MEPGTVSKGVRKSNSLIIFFMLKLEVTSFALID